MAAPRIPTLTTERLLLRPLCRSDYEDYAALYAAPEVVRYLGGDARPWDRGRAWRHLAFLVGHWQLEGTGMWAVEHRSTGAFLGTIGFAEPVGWPGCELAWILAPRWWGNGYATEGARAALAHAFERRKKERVISLIHPGNRASVRVAERIGLRFRERTDHILGERLCYALDRQEHRRQRRAEPTAPRPACLAPPAPHGAHGSALPRRSASPVS